MSDPASFNQTLFFSNIVCHIIDRLWEDFADKLGTSTAKLRSWLPQSFAKYLERTQATVGETRTLLSGEQSVKILDFFVPPSIELNGRLVNKLDLVEILKASTRIQLIGTGGSGKSVLMRYFFLVAPQEVPHIPVFVELRKLVPDDENAVWNEIVRVLAMNGKPNASVILDVMLTQGALLLLFDGLDEVPHAHRPAVEKQIQDLAARYSTSPIIVSSRPDETYGAWPGFQVGTILPPTSRQIKQIVQKLKYDQQIASLFLKELSTVATKHTIQSIVNTPLMVTILLLTYQDSAGLPNKRYLLYALAFDAMARRHDATKTGYKREFRAGLPLDDFRRLLSAVSYILYIKELFVFSRDEFGHAVSKACVLCKLEVQPESFLSDLTSSVCLLVKDGLQYTFVHRSFQEFFVATFVREAVPDDQEMLVEGIKRRVREDQVVRMLWEMDRSLVESMVFKPVLKDLASAVSGQPTVLDRYKTYLDWLQVHVECFAGQSARRFVLLHSVEREQIGNTDFHLRVSVVFIIIPLYLPSMMASKEGTTEHATLQTLAQTGTLPDRPDSPSVALSSVVSGDETMAIMSDAAAILRPSMVDGLLDLLQRFEKDQAVRRKAYDELFGRK